MLLSLDLSITFGFCFVRGIELFCLLLQLKINKHLLSSIRDIIGVVYMEICESESMLDPAGCNGNRSCCAFRTKRSKRVMAPPAKKSKFKSGTCSRRMATCSAAKLPSASGTPDTCATMTATIARPPTDDLTRSTSISVWVRLRKLRNTFGRFRPACC